MNRKIDLDELKAKLPEGIWFLTGGVLRMQLALKKRYSGDELEEKLKGMEMAMKIISKEEKIHFSFFDRNKEMIDSRIFDKSQVTFSQNPETNEWIVSYPKTYDYITGETIEETKKKMVQSGSLTEEEFDKYINPENWARLLRIEFNIIS